MSGHPHDRSIAALVVGTVLLCALVAVAVLGASGGAFATTDAADSDAAGAPTPHAPAASASGASAAAASDASGAAASEASAAAALDVAAASTPDAAAAPATDGAARSPTRPAASQAEPTLSISNASVAPDGSTTLELALTSVPDGLSGFQVTLELASSGVAAFEDAEYPERYGHSSTPAVADDGQSITVEAVDLHDEVTAGDADVALATVRVGGEAEGKTRVSVRDRQIDADGGDELRPALDPGAVRVSSGGSTDPSTATASAIGATDGDETGDGAVDERSADDGRLDPLRLGAVAVLLLASLVAAVAVRLRDRT